MAMPNCSPPPGGGFLLLRWAGGGLGWFWNESEEEGLWAHLAAAQSPTPLPLRKKTLSHGGSCICATSMKYCVTDNEPRSWKRWWFVLRM
ncbi:hypothetical protein BDA96_06G248500 [Sorghum bicolor]|uniref:Uncharacterized protein n=2 Tax=Sorghum bicolor TaxID=4558 RepID=A0A1Z5RFM8_SORBI|nr:hypothetical protein BDA96_06G248500 [Sorghum bicolor]OQU82389.1 hypothetical protein SORBI_3006G226601 [Sorghum bicolor]